MTWPIGSPEGLPLPAPTPPDKRVRVRRFSCLGHGIAPALASLAAAAPALTPRWQHPSLCDTVATDERCT